VTKLTYSINFKKTYAGLVIVLCVVTELGVVIIQERAGCSGGQLALTNISLETEG
jgi:hypothetical protein